MLLHRADKSGRQWWWFREHVYVDDDRLDLDDVTALLHQRAARKQATIERAKAELRGNIDRPTGQPVPESVRHEVWRRDAGTCSSVSTFSGQRPTQMLSRPSRRSVGRSQYSTQPSSWSSRTAPPSGPPSGRPRPSARRGARAADACPTPRRIAGSPASSSPRRGSGRPRSCRRSWNPLYWPTPACPIHAPNGWKHARSTMRGAGANAPQTRMAAGVSSRPSSSAVAIGTACHAEGRGFESLHPLHRTPGERGFSVARVGERSLDCNRACNRNVEATHSHERAADPSTSTRRGHP